MRRRRHLQERWLHTRISGPLQDALKREARRRRLPVSLLVRNVLEGALDLVEDIVEDSLAVARRSQDVARNVGRAWRAGSETDHFEEIYGWQELILNRSATCVRCDTELVGGATAHRGLRDRPGDPVFLCAACIRRLGQPATDGGEEPR